MAKILVGLPTGTIARCQDYSFLPLNLTRLGGLVLCIPLLGLGIGIAGDVGCGVCQRWERRRINKNNLLTPDGS
ncbi:MAG: hypothetical protein EWV79_13375 [Microcystis aeruginosa Ma_MB_S_20031200_S102D]|nr:MAG: hypothetical protein EWV79_13375 [Microcystis aeruginosa Ma_MB_S_20031200_S102D]